MIILQMILEACLVRSYIFYIFETVANKCTMTNDIVLERTVPCMVIERIVQLLRMRWEAVGNDDSWYLYWPVKNSRSFLMRDVFACMSHPLLTTTHVLSSTINYRHWTWTCCKMRFWYTHIRRLSLIIVYARVWRPPPQKKPQIQKKVKKKTQNKYLYKYPLKNPKPQN